jgi:hypothetical protein
MYENGILTLTEGFDRDVQDLEMVLARSLGFKSVQQRRTDKPKAKHPKAAMLENGSLSAVERHKELLFRAPRLSFLKNSESKLPPIAKRG